MCEGRIGFLKWVGPMKVIFVEDADGWVRIFKRPEKGHRYVSGSDVSEGIEVIEWKERDKNATDIFDLKTMEQCAQMIHRLEANVHGEELYKLLLYYNKAFAGIENNKDPGVVLYLKSNNYVNLYYEEDFEKSVQVMNKRAGWNTNLRTRPLMISKLSQMIREGKVIIHSPVSFSQMGTFVRYPDGKARAQAGSFDDDVFAIMIALMLSDCIPVDLEGEMEDQAQEQSWEDSKEYQNQNRNKLLAGAGYFGR
jgi:hypothetical protein